MKYQKYETLCHFLKDNMYKGKDVSSLTSEDLNNDFKFLLPQNLLVAQSITASSTTLCPRYWLDCVPVSVIKDRLQLMSKTVQACTPENKEILQQALVQYPIIEAIPVVFDQTEKNQKMLNRYGFLAKYPEKRKTMDRLKFIKADFKFYRNPKTLQYISIICDKDKIKVKDYTMPKDCEIVTKNYGYIKLTNKEFDKIFDE